MGTSKKDGESSSSPSGSPPDSNSSPPPSGDNSSSSPPPSPPPSPSSDQSPSPPSPPSDNNNNNNDNNGDNNNDNNNGDNNNNNNNDNNNNKNSPPPPNSNNDNDNSNNNNNKNNNNNNNNNENNNKDHNNNNNNHDSSNSPPSKNKSPSGQDSRSPPSPPGSRGDSQSSLSPPAPGLSGNSSSSSNVPLIAGLVVGIGVLLLLLIIIVIVCSKRRKKKSNHPDSLQYYSNNHSQKPQNYSAQHYSGQHGGPWHSSPGQPQDSHMMYSNATGMSSGQQQWGAPMPPPPPPMMSTDMSAGYSSGPTGPALPPPHPSVALGFNKSTFSYEELAAATNGFSQVNLLGQGGFGFVHKGVLPNGKEVAVKSLKSGSGQGEREFQAEVDIISRVHHRHLVSLVGYCIAGGQRMLVYEFVPNDTLEFHLHGKGRPVMDFPSRMKIALGSARGLAYLHEDCHPRIIHRDIKTANILIDLSFEAKVADFGLAKLSSDTFTHVSTRVMGTFGYLAPEYAASGKLTEKSDVFSFGVMLLELVTGRRPIDPSADEEDTLVDWARPLISRVMDDGVFDGLVDPRLGNEFDQQEMLRLVACAGASIRHSAKRRPKMSQIVRALEGDVSLDDLNVATKPGPHALVSSSGGSSDYDTTSYNKDMQNFRRTVLNSTEYTSSEYGATNEYGRPSSAESTGMTRKTSPGPGQPL